MTRIERAGNEYARAKLDKICRDGETRGRQRSRLDFRTLFYCERLEAAALDGRTMITGSTNKHRKLHDLMQVRVREVLLVSSLYDSYILQEDGHLTEKVYVEYAELKLSSAPRFTHVSTGEEALALMDARRFDLVLVVMRQPDPNVVEFARQVKARRHAHPVVVLAFDNRQMKRLERVVDDPAIDGVFAWSGDAKILLAISKYIEDRENVDRDIAVADVRVILVVEDSIRYYSSFLAALYPELMQQSQSLFSEGLNRLQRLMRMRTRPKILLARTFEQANALYDRYHDNLMAVISDAGFPRDGEHDPEAGLRFLRRVREDISDLPVLLQSAQERFATAEGELRVLFVNKSSSRLLSRLRRFLQEDLGFGPFIFRLPDRTELYRARDTAELEQYLRHVPAASLEYHASRNHFSNWLVARGEFEISKVMRPQQVSDYETAEELRSATLEELRNLRRGGRAGVISDLSEDVFDTEGLFTRIGKGSLGGKARGIAFLNLLLSGGGAGVQLGGMRVRIPQCFVVATDAFDDFLEHNDLYEIAFQSEDDERITRRFLDAELPETVETDLRRILRHVEYPLAIRSSSLLEDNMLHPFAGIYGTVMLANSAETLEERLDELRRAIKYIYATTFFQNARVYLKNANRRTEEEKMAVVIQELVGRRYDSRFYPHCSGVAHSYDYYAVGDQKPEDGAVQLALGFGQIIVEGGSFVRFCPRDPTAPSRWSSTQNLVNSSQRWFYALDLARPLAIEGAKLPRSMRLHDLETADRDGTLRPVASVYDAVAGTLSEGADSWGAPVVTFSRILHKGLVPIAPALAELLELMSSGMGGAVELEFACDLGRWGEDLRRPPTGQPTIYALQSRPLITRDLIDDHTGEIFDPDGIVCRSELAVGRGRRVVVHDVVYVRQDAYDPAHTPTIAVEIGRLNRELEEASRTYVLLGPGRWGSANHWLGIPVRWRQISAARVIVEASPPDFATEPSQGTHFFNNIMSLGAGYFIIPPATGSGPQRGFVDWDWLDAQPAAYESRFLRHLHFERPIVATVDGRRGVGTIAYRRQSDTPQYDHLSDRR